MANLFSREPIISGDNNIWGNYSIPYHRLGIGNISCYVYDDSGTLTVSKGKIGFDDNTNKGSIEVNDITTVSIAALTASRWAYLEAYITGTAVSFVITSIPSGSDSTVIPTTFLNAFNGEKGGFYINSNKRTIALVWIDSGGNLAGIINQYSNCNGFSGNSEDTSFCYISRENVLVNLKVTDIETDTIEASTSLITPLVKAKDANGLELQDDGGNTGVFVEDGGQVGIGNTSPSYDIDITGKCHSSLGTWHTAFVATAGAATISQDAVFDFLAPYVPNTGDYVCLGGGVRYSGAYYDLLWCYRTDATNISIQIRSLNVTVTDGNAAAIFDYTGITVH